MNERHARGAAAELKAAARLAELGYIIYYPLLTQSKADLVIERDGKFQKVQVKRATRSEAGGNPFIQIRLGGAGRLDYTDGDFDVLAMVYEDRLWLLPWGMVKGKTSMSFSVFEGQNPRRDISQYEVTNGQDP